MTTTESIYKNGIEIEEFNTYKQIRTNKDAVAYLPFCETLILAPVNKTYIEPNKTRTSLIKTAYRKYWGIIDDNQNSNIKNTTLSVKGSRIIPNLDTKLNFRATIPSKESDKPIKAIIKIRVNELNSSGMKLIKR